MTVITSQLDSRRAGRLLRAEPVRAIEDFEKCTKRAFSAERSQEVAPYQQLNLKRSHFEPISNPIESHQLIENR